MLGLLDSQTEENMVPVLKTPTFISYDVLDRPLGVHQSTDERAPGPESAGRDQGKLPRGSELY